MLDERATSQSLCAASSSGLLRVQDAELVAPRVPQHPGLEASLLLVVVPSSPKGLQSLNLGLGVIRLDVVVHPLPPDPLVVGSLEQHSNLRVEEAELPLDSPTPFTDFSSSVRRPSAA